MGLTDSTSIVMGIIIGSAIFIVPAEITREVGSAHTALAVWIATGVLSLFGALTFAELASMLPQAGGQYIYLREVYGPMVSFLCGWTFFLAAQSGSIAAVAVGFGQYLGHFLPLNGFQIQCAAVASVAVFTLINYRGVREGGTVQTLLTGLKVGAMVALVVLSYVMLRHAAHGSTHLAGGSAVKGFGASFGVAMVAALWAYDGWNNVTFAAGEVKNPERNVPLALMLGTLAVVALYVLLNLAYYRVLTVAQVAGSERVAADAAVKLLGQAGAQFVTAAIMISMLGAVNGLILAGARVYYAMAIDGLFFASCSRVHPRFRTPHLSLLLQGAWTIALIMMARYEQLFTYVIFTEWVFYALAAWGVIAMRRSRPNAPRPYRVWGYPVVPLLFVLTAVGFIINTLVQEPVAAGWGAFIVALGIPVYWVWRHNSAARLAPKDAAH